MPGSPGVVEDEVLLDEPPLPLGLLPRDADRLPRRHVGVDVVPDGPGLAVVVTALRVVHVEHGAPVAADALPCNVKAMLEFWYTQYFL